MSWLGTSQLEQVESVSRNDKLNFNSMHNLSFLNFLENSFQSKSSKSLMIRLTQLKFLIFTTYKSDKHSTVKCLLLLHNFSRWLSSLTLQVTPRHLQTTSLNITALSSTQFAYPLKILDLKSIKSSPLPAITIANRNPVVYDNMEESLGSSQGKTRINLISAVFYFVFSVL